MSLNGNSVLGLAPAVTTPGAADVWRQNDDDEADTTTTMMIMINELLCSDEAPKDPEIIRYTIGDTKTGT